MKYNVFSIHFIIQSIKYLILIKLEKVKFKLDKTYLLMVMVMVMVKIDDQGRIIIPKEIRERKKLIEEVEIKEIDEGIIIKPKKSLTWKEFLENKLKIDWNKVQKLNLSEVNLDDIWL